MDKKRQYEELWCLLSTSVSANLQFAQYVINQEPINTKYFFGDYSYDIVKWIAIKLFDARGEEIDKTLCRIYGDYFEFVTGPYNDINQPQWYQLRTYKGENKMKLKSWLMKNAGRDFARKRKNFQKIANSEREMLDYVDYESLLSLEKDQDDMRDEQYIYKKRLKRAWDTLSDKDKDIIHYLVIEKLNWEDAFEELSHYINPRKGKEVMKTWDSKRKQDAIAVLKGRAIKHLIKRFKAEKN